MNMEANAMGTNAQDVVYKGVAQNQLLTPKFQIHEMVGHSISSPLHEVAESVPFRLCIDEHLLIEERSGLAKRSNDAYTNQLEPEEQEFLDLTREHFSRLNDE